MSDIRDDFRPGALVAWVRQAGYEVGESGIWTAAQGQKAKVSVVDDEYIHLEIEEPGFFLRDYNGGHISIPIGQAGDIRQIERESHFISKVDDLAMAWLGLLLPENLPEGGTTVDKISRDPGCVVVYFSGTDESGELPQEYEGSAVYYRDGTKPTITWYYTLIGE